VNVQVFREPRAGTFAEIYADVESVGLYRQAKKLLSIPYQLGHFEKLVIGCLVQIADMSQWCNQQVAVIVGETIENYDTGFGSPQDEIIIIVFGFAGAFAEKTFALVGKTLNVSNTPRRP
jgi:hypothetical protein